MCDDGETPEQPTMHNALRWIWIISIGWWLAPLWLVSGLLICCTIVGLPIGYKMISSTYTILTGNFN